MTLNELDTKDETHDPREMWAFTFGYDSDRRKNYVVYVGNFHEAREGMVSDFGNKWAFQYPWDEFQSQISDYDLVALEVSENE